MRAASSADAGNTHILALRRMSPNAPPTVSLTSPSDGAHFGGPVTITASATASDPDGTVASVTFQVIQIEPLVLFSPVIVTQPPYVASLLLNTSCSAPPCRFSISARAKDNQETFSESVAVSVTVSPNAGPSVSLTSPANGATFSAPADIALTATAADSDGSVSSVAFYNGANLITTLTSAPYSFTWPAVPQGSYSLTAKATDNLGVTTTSAPANITVNAGVAKLHFIQVDHLNTPRLVADAAGTTVWKWDQTEPFGSNPADENPGGFGTFDLPLRLPGQYFDKETNVHYNYFRDYDAALGRYIQSDPIGLAGGLNTYAYAASHPTSASDFFGLASSCQASNQACADGFAKCVDDKRNECFMTATIVCGACFMTRQGVLVCLAGCATISYLVCQQVAQRTCKELCK